MAAVISLIVVLTGSILVTKIATAALSYTGLSRESSRFQARSAFTGAGFTTNEAEKVVSHPVRRRIVLLLMLLGNAGIISVISSLILSFVGKDLNALDRIERLGMILGAIVLLWFMAASPVTDRLVGRLVGWALRRWTRLDVKDYASLLHVAGDWRVHEMLVEQEDWMADRRLRHLGLREEGVLVLGIQRTGGGRYLGAPTADTVIRAGDVLVLYGRDAAIGRLDERRRGRSGDIEHEAAVEEQETVVEREQAEEAGEARSEEAAAEEEARAKAREAAEAEDAARARAEATERADRARAEREARRRRKAR